MLSKTEQNPLPFPPETQNKPLAVPGVVSFVTIFCFKASPTPSNSHQQKFIFRGREEECKRTLVIIKEGDGRRLLVQKNIDLGNNTDLMETPDGKRLPGNLLPPLKAWVG